MVKTLNTTTTPKSSPSGGCPQLFEHVTATSCLRSFYFVPLMVYVIWFQFVDKNTHIKYITSSIMKRQSSRGLSLVLTTPYENNKITNINSGFIGTSPGPNSVPFRNATAVAGPDLLVQKQMCRKTKQAYDCAYSRPCFAHNGVNVMNLEEDDVLYGKSCKFIERDDNAEDPAPPTWLCRDCGTECKYDKYEDCPIVQPGGNGGCSVTDRLHWDNPSQILTKHQSFAAGTSHYEHVYNHPYKKRQQGVQGGYVERLPCKNLLDPECFDLTQCSSSLDGPLKVFVYGEQGMAANFTASIEGSNPGLIQVVKDPSEACLKIVSCYIFSPWKDTEPFVSQFDHGKLIRDPNWDEGKNHFIWDANKCFSDWGDNFYHPVYTFQRASMSVFTMNRIAARTGFDVPIPLYGKGFSVNATHIQQYLSVDDTARDRRYLVSFKGGILLGRFQQWWYNHRYLAERYWPHDDSQVLLDAKCSHRAAYRLPVDQYHEIMLESTFAFCPGGLSQGSFRFHEALSLGAIPVVTNDFLAPFEPDLDWSGCLVRVSESRVADIPRLLRELYTTEHIQRRRARCKTLFNNAIGFNKPNATEWHIDQGRVGFEMAMKVWSARVRGALSHRGHVELSLG